MDGDIQLNNNNNNNNNNTLSENLNTITKGHLGVVFNTVKYIVSNWNLLLQTIGVNRFFMEF